MLRSIKLEKLVISAIPELVETWTEGFGFERLEDDERRGLRRTVNLMVFPGTVWLKKSLCRSQVSEEQQISMNSCTRSYYHCFCCQLPPLFFWIAWILIYIGEIGSCSASSSGKDDLGVSGTLFEGSHETQPAIKPEVCLSSEELDVKTELVPGDGNDIQIDKDVKESMDIHCRKLSYEEKDENNHLEVHPNSMEVYIEREHTEQVEKSNAKHNNSEWSSWGASHLKCM